jgi:tetratricopeptide (TPR) repeat protein
MLVDKKIQNYVEWGQIISHVKDIMLRCRQNRSAEDLIDATRCIKRAVEISWQFPSGDMRRFITLSTAIALFCHLGCYSYVEFDRQMLLRMAKRYPRPIFGDILNNLGMLYQEHGKINEAGQLYRQAIRLLPPNHRRFNLLVSNLESLIKLSIPKESA